MRTDIKALGDRQAAIDDRLEIARLQLDQAQKASQTGTETFQAWIQTRTATTNPQQDPEVIARTRTLEQLKGNERVDPGLDRRAGEREAAAPAAGIGAARQAVAARGRSQPALERAQFWQELRVFLLRLAITLPMLLVATWMVLKRRQSDYWPLHRGFVIAAVFVFFVELVPYLPSYGGYVRYGVGIFMTLAAGHFLVKNLRTYLAQRQAVEQQAEQDRRKLVSHDEAFKKMAAKQCPGCDRPIAAMDGIETNFCVHCGMTLYNHCSQCDVRKMAFFRYCVSCGIPAEETAKAVA